MNDKGHVVLHLVVFTLFLSICFNSSFIYFIWAISGTYVSYISTLNK